MLELTQRGESRSAKTGAITGSVTLSFKLRQRSRLRTRLDDGRDVAIVLAHGQTLRGGERLGSSCGEIILVHAERELLSEIASFNLRELARAAYHLENRNVSVQVGANWLRYAHDHVIDEMLLGLGMAVKHVNEGFEPESGADAAVRSLAHEQQHTS